MGERDGKDSMEELSGGEGECFGDGEHAESCVLVVFNIG